MAEDLLTVAQFGATIKAKYPDYAAVPDAELGAKMLAKYPEYQTRIKPADAATSRATPFNAPRLVDQPQAALLGATPAQALDVGKGVVKGAIHSAIGAGQLVAPVLRQIPGVKNYVATPDQFQQASDATAYSNTAQQVGGGIETAAELAVPVGKAVEAIPTTAKAAAKFQDVMGAAKDLPVSVASPGAVALRIQELADRGGSMPMAVRKFLGRITNPEKGALNYEEARDFASNISRLSADEYGRLTPVVGREVANLRVALNKAVAETAAQAGKGKEYAEAMSEYRRAMQIRGVFESALDGIKRGAPYLTAGGLGVYLTKKLAGLLGNER